jgi:hypothetical protein
MKQNVSNSEVGSALKITSTWQHDESKDSMWNRTHSNGNIQHAALRLSEIQQAQSAMFILYINAYLPHAAGSPLSIWVLRKCTDTERCVSESDSHWEARIVESCM